MLKVRLTTKQKERYKKLVKSLSPFQRKVKGHEDEFKEFSENYLRVLDKIEDTK